MMRWLMHSPEEFRSFWFGTGQVCRYPAGPPRAQGPGIIAMPRPLL